MKKISLSVFIIAGLSCAVFGVKITPVADISLFGGQCYMGDESSSIGGNSHIYFSPVVNFLGKTAIVPVLSINYRGTADIQELVGGDTLTRQSFNYGATFKLVHSFKMLKVKARFAWMNALINETEDEDWQEGLFDYKRMLYGIETEKLILGYIVSFFGDFYTMEFPNYDSLVSQAKDEFNTSIDTQTYREISANSGKSVLDYSNITMGLNAGKDYSNKVKAFFSYRLDLRDYADQSIVLDDGSFSANLRKDRTNTFSSGLEFRTKKVSVGLGNETGILKSNQNSYDANSPKFIEDFYSYYFTRFYPSVMIYPGTGKRQIRLKLWWTVGFKRYIRRLAQDKDADYLTDKVRQDDNTFGVSYTYPLTGNINITGRVSTRTLSSNMKYEVNYKYNYTIRNYFLELNLTY